MCLVHLIETSRATRPVAARVPCCYCGALIANEGVFIEGRLDDGSPGLHRFVYHDECVWDMEHDLDEINAHDGCFSYGAAHEVLNTPLELQAQ